MATQVEAAVDLRGVSRDLSEAIKSGNLKWVQDNTENIKRLIESKSYFDEDGRTPLHTTASICPASVRKEIFEELLDLHIDPTIADESGWTCLHIISSTGHDDIIESLKHFFKENNVKDYINRPTQYGTTALMYAASKGHLECLRLLIQWGADINYKDPMNSTAISRAVAAGRENTFEYLLELQGIELDMVEKGSQENLLHMAVNSDRADFYYKIAMACPPLEELKDAEGQYPLGRATPTFMKKLEYEFKSRNLRNEEDMS